MKKIIALALVAVMCLSFAACGGSGSSGTYYKLGDTVSTDIFEFTLNAAEFTIALSNINDDNRFTPKEYDAQDDSNNPYVAPVGHTYAALSYTVTNLDRASKEFHSGSFASVKYDGKKYSSLKEGAYFIYADKQVMQSSGVMSTIEAGEWYGSPGSNFLLMVGAKETRRAYIDIETEIKDLTETVELTVEIPTSSGEKSEFTYLITEEDRAGYTKPEIEMSLELACSSFVKDEAEAYFAEHLDEFAVVTGDRISAILKGKWDVDYNTQYGYWSGTFWFESDGRIKDDYGYVNDRTWSVEGDTVILDGEIECEMREVSERTFLLVAEGKPYLLMQ